MELGGKSANIIFASADYERALDSALIGIFQTMDSNVLLWFPNFGSGKIFDKFVEEFVQRTKKVKLEIRLMTRQR